MGVDCRRVIEADITVEYIQPPGAQVKSWCLKRWDQIVDCEPQLDPVLAMARAMASERHCAAWLLVAGSRILVSPFGDPPLA